MKIPLVTRLAIYLSVIIGLMYLVYGGIGQESHGLAFTAGGGGDNLGVYIYVKSNFTLINVTKTSTTTVNLSSIYNGSGALLAVSPFVNNTANFTLALIAGQNYTIDTNQTSVSIDVNHCNAVQTTRPVNGSVIDWVNGTFGGVVGANGGSFCSIESITYSNDLLGANANTFNLTTYETETQTFTSNFTFPSSSVSTVNLIYAQQSYASTVSTTTQANSNYTFTRTIDVPLGSTIGIWYWNITFTNGTVAPSTTFTQPRSIINLSICGASPQNRPYINFTFKNETTAQENINATIPSSTFVYWLGTGTVNRSLLYSNAAETANYGFCFNPPHRSVNTNIELSYDNAESQQRNFILNGGTLSNVTRLETLYLLPTDQGIFSPFQTVTTSGSALSGVTATISRTIGSSIVQVATATSDSSGFVTFFLNPDVTYTATFSKTGFPDNTFTFIPTTDLRTVTMGASGAGITNGTVITVNTTYQIIPSNTTLINNTVYTFGFNVSSSQSITLISMNITNSSGFQLLYASNAGAGFISGTLNTVSNTTFIGRYIISTGTESFTINRIFIIGETYVGDYSIFRQFSLFTQYGFSDFIRILLVIVFIMAIVVLLSSNELIDTSESKILVVVLAVWIFSMFGWLDTGIGIASNNDSVNKLGQYSSKYGIAILTSCIGAYFLFRRIE